MDLPLSVYCVNCDNFAIGYGNFLASVLAFRLDSERYDVCFPQWPDVDLVNK